MFSTFGDVPHRTLPIGWLRWRASYARRQARRTFHYESLRHHECAGQLLLERTRRWRLCSNSVIIGGAPLSVTLYLAAVRMKRSVKFQMIFTAIVLAGGLTAT